MTAGVEDSAIAFASSQGNAMRPVIIANFLHSATILADACSKLREYCIEGTEQHRDQVDGYMSPGTRSNRAGPESVNSA